MNLRAALAKAPARPAPIAPVRTQIAEAVASTVVKLRDYQQTAVEAVRMAFRDKVKSVLLVAPTGAGKTVIFSYIAKAAAAKQSRVLILAHRDQLIKQASAKLKQNDVGHGVIMAGFTPNPRRMVQVASVQTLVRRVDKMKEAGVGFDLIIVDECIRGDSVIETDVGSIQIQQVVEKGAKLVRSFNGCNDVWMPIEAFADKGVRKTVTVRHQYGEIVCTPNHLFFTDTGWKRADQLTKSSLVYVHADAAQKPLLQMDDPINGQKGTEYRCSHGLTGRKDMMLQCVAGRSARAAAANWSQWCSNLQKTWSKDGLQKGSTTSSSLGINAGGLSFSLAFPLNKNVLSLGRYWGTQASCLPIAKPSTRDFVGTTDRLKPTGRNIKRDSLVGWPLSSKSPKMEVTALSQFGVLHHVTLNYSRSMSLVMWGRLSALLRNGWKTLIASVLRGGTVTTGILTHRDDWHIYIPKALTKKVSVSSWNGWINATAVFQPISRMATGLFGFAGKQQAASYQKFGRTSQSSFGTNWSRIQDVSEGLSCRVFDIQVGETECFYANGVLVHNCHLSAAKSYQKIFDAFPNARLLGVTGSPIRLDGKGLGTHAGGSYDLLIEGPNIKQLIDEGFLVRPAVFASKVQIDLSAVKKTAGDYDSEALSNVMDKPVITGSAIEHYKKICPGVPAVAWCVSVAHAIHVAEQFNAAGIPALALSGANDSAERDKALADLTSGKIKVITFAMLLVEGVDCPAIGAVILLRPTMSLASYLQTIGRGLRTIYGDGMDLETIEGRKAAIAAGPKGDRCFVLDHAGLCFRHGLPDEVREWSLDGAVKKATGKKKAEPEVKVLQCKKCWLCHDPAPVCPACGYVYEVKVRELNEVEGELTEITKEMSALIRSQRMSEQSSARTLEELEALGAKRGYKASWARNVFQARSRKR